MTTTNQNQVLVNVYQYLRHNQKVKNQVDFSEKVGVTKQTMSLYLSGTRRLPKKLEAKIEIAFEISFKKFTKAKELPMKKAAPEYVFQEQVIRQLVCIQAENMVLRYMMKELTKETDEVLQALYKSALLKLGVPASTVKAMDLIS